MEEFFFFYNYNCQAKPKKEKGTCKDCGIVNRGRVRGLKPKVNSDFQYHELIHDKFKVEPTFAHN